MNAAPLHRHTARAAAHLGQFDRAASLSRLRSGVEALFEAIERGDRSPAPAVDLVLVCLALVHTHGWRLEPVLLATTRSRRSALLSTIDRMALRPDLSETCVSLIVGELLHRFPEIDVAVATRLEAS